MEKVAEATREKVAIDEALLCYLIEKSGIKNLDEFELWVKGEVEIKPKVEHAHIKKSKKIKVEFKPNPNLGEAGATKEELNYRQVLILYLKPVWDSAKKIIIESDLSLQEKHVEINKLIENFISNVQKVAQSTVTSRYNAGYTRMEGYVKKAKYKIPSRPKEQPRLDTLLLQQTMNIEDIGLTLRGKLRQILNIKAVQDFYEQGREGKPDPEKIKKAVPKPNWTVCMKRVAKEHPEWSEAEVKKWCEVFAYEEEIDKAVDDSKRRVDAIGMFGFLESDKAGYLQAALLLSVGITELTMKIPWVTMGDANVCSDCLAREAEGPYYPEDYPEDQHYGERCVPGEPVFFKGVLEDVWDYA
ncbi:MAG: hypothetical protein AMQ22_01227 [Candidatus Methanofastidiosum methylothiophilum]|uniref:Uncharacterized protein n=1 Tax=Candidatus Methanofastidiosum methylothiophilum TaxID=1705564 RepID=A0A150J374_9EURY|nr:MAG: hypothetical protein AMQ22_01227 [Candidatus Methanofastidiosum methylthiophilus]